MKKILLLAVLAITFFACSNYGDKVVYDGTEVYYKDPALKGKAEATGEFLQEIQFTDGTTKSIQVTKDSVYNFRMVAIPEKVNDPEMEVSFQALGMLLSNDVFDGEAINFQLCDEVFKTVRTIYIEGETGSEAMAQ